MYELPTLAREAGKLKMLPRRRTHARGVALPPAVLPVACLGEEVEIAPLSGRVAACGMMTTRQFLRSNLSCPAAPQSPGAQTHSLLPSSTFYLRRGERERERERESSRVVFW